MSKARLWRHLVRMTVAALSIAVGIAGLILPVLPGWLFFGVAALLLFPETRLARKVLAKIEHRWPRTHRVLRFLTET